MSLSTALLVVFLVLMAIVAFGWATIANWVIGLFALAAAIAFVVEGLTARTFTIGRK